jgi:hypothetical protein
MPRQPTPISRIHNAHHDRYLRIHDEHHRKDHLENAMENVDIIRFAISIGLPYAMKYIHGEWKHCFAHPIKA